MSGELVEVEVIGSVSCLGLSHLHLVCCFSVIVLISSCFPPFFLSINLKVWFTYSDMTQVSNCVLQQLMVLLQRFMMKK